MMAIAIRTVEADVLTISDVFCPKCSHAIGASFKDNQFLDAQIAHLRACGADEYADAVLRAVKA